MARLDKFALFAAVGYKPHDIQRAVHASSASRRVLCAGVRFGKSVVCIHEGLAALLAPGPSALGWFVTPTRETTALLIGPLFDLLERHFPHRVLDLDRGAQRAAVRNFAGQRTVVQGHSADRPDKLLGASVAWMIIDEAARLRPEIWREFLAQRLVDRDGWALFSSTPRGTGDWFSQLFQRGERQEEGFASWNAPTWSNPAISQEVIDAARSQLDERTFFTEFGAELIGPLGRTCPTCGSPRELQYPYAILMSGEELGECTGCGRPLTPRGEPAGVVREDGGVDLYVIQLRPDVPAPHPGDPCSSRLSRPVQAPKAS
jgi:hypothetical protein